LKTKSKKKEQKNTTKKQRQAPKGKATTTPKSKHQPPPTNPPFLQLKRRERGVPCFFASLRANARRADKTRLALPLSFCEPFRAMSCFFVSDSEQKPPIPWGHKARPQKLGQSQANQRPKRLQKC